MQHYNTLREAMDNECMAYVVAYARHAGFADTSDQDGVKSRRRQRYNRRKAQHRGSL